MSFIRELLQWTTSLWWTNEVLHVLEMKYFIQELFGRFLPYFIQELFGHFLPNYVVEEW